MVINYIFVKIYFWFGIVVFNWAIVFLFFFYLFLRYNLILINFKIY